MILYCGQALANFILNFSQSNLCSDKFQINIDSGQD